MGVYGPLDNQWQQAVTEGLSKLPEMEKSVLTTLLTRLWLHTFPQLGQARLVRVELEGHEKMFKAEDQKHSLDLYSKLSAIANHPSGH